MTGSTDERRQRLHRFVPVVLVASIGAIVVGRLATRPPDHETRVALGPTEEESAPPAEVVPTDPGVVVDFNAPTWLEGSVYDARTGEPVCGLYVFVDQRELWERLPDELAESLDDLFEQNCCCPGPVNVTDREGRFCIDDAIPSWSMSLVVRERGRRGDGDLARFDVEHPGPGTYEVDVGPTISFAAGDDGVEPGSSIRLSGNIDGEAVVIETRVQSVLGPRYHPWARFPSQVVDLDGPAPWTCAVVPVARNRVGVFELARRTGIDPTLVSVQWVETGLVLDGLDDAKRTRAGTDER